MFLQYKNLYVNQIVNPKTTVTATTLLVLTLLTSIAYADKFVPKTLADSDMLDNGNILVTDAGPGLRQDGGGIYEIDRAGNIIWSYTDGLRWAHNADRQLNGNVIISDTGHNRVLIINSAGSVIWDTDNITLSDNSVLNYPNDANLLANGNILITDRDNHRVFEIDETGNIVWQFGVTGIPGNGANNLFGPHNADRLPDGNTIIADSINRRVIEVNPAGTIVWSYNTGLRWPRDADRLPDGNTLINDSNNYRLLEVDINGNTVWELSLPAISYDSDRLANGNTLYDAGKYLYEVNTAGDILWSYPALSEEVWVHNPTSGVELYCNVHRPTDFDPQQKYPAVVLVPGGSGTGDSFLTNGRAQRFAEMGFIVMRFDPDGRGESTNNGTYTIEDYDGYIQQDGLREVLQYLTDLPETDDANIGIFTFSYGITMGAGTVGRYPQNPPVKFLIDWEGPADRSDTAWPNGHVEHDINDDIWWYEHEPTNFIDDYNGYFLVLQSEIDHVQSDNEHSIKLNNAGTHTKYGGFGRCLWTRVNSETGITFNPPNSVYSMAEQPQYISEDEDEEQLYDQYLVEMALKFSVPLTLQASPLKRGQSVTLVTSDALPANRVYFVYSFAGEGTTYIGQLGIALDLKWPINLAGSAMTNQNGLAVYQSTIPQNAPLINVWIQSAQLLPGGGALKSNVVTDRITQ